MHKKRGFTLVELLVVIAVTTLLLTTVGGTYIFMAQSQGNLLDKSSELFFAQQIADYFTDTCANELKNQLGDKTEDVKAIFKNANIANCKIYKNDEDSFIRCTLTFNRTITYGSNSNNTYTFIIGKTTNDGG